MLVSRLRRGTLQDAASVQGVGVHSGQSSSVTLRPAPCNAGIRFVRSDLPGSPAILASVENVSSTQFSTTLGHGHATISTVEHLMAALWAAGVTDVEIQVNCAEIPILDGSSARWLDILKSTGVKQYAENLPTLYVQEPVEIAHGAGWLKIRPADTFSASMTVALDDDICQTFTYREADSFEEHIAEARTFSLKKNVEAMYAKGLIKGGSLENALVIKNGKAVNAEGFRFDSECARHKILDLIGDWALCGRLVKGHVEGFQSGHALNHQLISALLKAEQMKTAQQHACVVSYAHPTPVSAQALLG